MAPTENLHPDDLEQKIAEFRLLGYSWRDIERQLGVNYETARRTFKKTQKRLLKEHTDFKMQQHLAEERARFDYLIREASLGWLRSVGKMTKTSNEVRGGVIGKDKNGKPGKPGTRPKVKRQSDPFDYESDLEAKLNELGGLSETKDKTIEWYEAGDPRFISLIKDLMVERNRLLGAYDKDRDDDEQIEAVRYEQDVYIPGIGIVTPELIRQLLQRVPEMPSE